MFVDEVNNKVNGPILAVPIVAYHMIDNNKTPYSTDITLFDREIKYLHDNGFKVLTVNDLGYDTKNNFLYIKPSVARLTAANPVNLTKSSSINVEGKNGIVTKSSAIIQNNTVLVPLSSNSSAYLSHPMPRINHLSFPTNSRSSASSGLAGHPNGKSNNHHFSASSGISGSRPNGKSSSIMGTTVPTAITKVT